MMQAREQVKERSRAEALAAHLDRRWRGQRTDDQTDTMIRAVCLLSADLEVHDVDGEHHSVLLDVGSVRAIGAAIESAAGRCA